MSADEEDEPEVVDSDNIEPEADAAPAREETVELRSKESRSKLRDQMEADIEAFLRRGGRIEQVEPTATAQPGPATGPTSGDTA